MQPHGNLPGGRQPSIHSAPLRSCLTGRERTRGLKLEKADLFIGKANPPIGRAWALIREGPIKKWGRDHGTHFLPMRALSRNRRRPENNAPSCSPPGKYPPLAFAKSKYSSRNPPGYLVPQRNPYAIKLEYQLPTQTPRISLCSPRYRPECLLRDARFLGAHDQIEIAQRPDKSKLVGSPPIVNKPTELAVAPASETAILSDSERANNPPKFMVVEKNCSHPLLAPSFTN